MKTIPSARVKAVTTSLRRAFLVAGVLAFIAGIQLFILTEHTDQYFAWTIQPPLMAAFLGAGYWAAVVVVLFAIREPAWVRVRVAAPTALVVTTLLLIATLLHLDRFHFGSSSGETLSAAWAWIIVYVVVPPAAIALLVGQFRAPGVDPPRQASLSRWLRIVLGLHALVALVVGIALFLFPQGAASFWPWMLTPLTAQAAGADCCGVGVLAAMMVWENDRKRVQVGMVGYTAFSAFALLALARYLETVHWNQPSAWLYLFFLLSMLAIGLADWFRGQRA